ncbi:MAG: 50S ribosomal protein L18 [Planctomycetes bacterium]|nr:50S ribosomal protein L18 [Planctomycetota bacterium]
MEKQRAIWFKRERRHLRVRKKVFGTSQRPRLSIYRSLNHIYAQIIDDTKSQTLCAASTQSETIKKALKTCGNKAAAQAVGKHIAETAVKQGIQKVVFDRGSYLYHGRIKALADAARAGGLKF